MLFAFADEEIDEINLSEDSEDDIAPDDQAREVVLVSDAGERPR